MSEYKNANIRVTWEDYPENFTEERINRVKETFQRKYGTGKVHVKTTPIINFKATKLSSLDITENVSDFQYQKKLMMDFIKENDIKADINYLNKLDDRINIDVQTKMVNSLKYNKWHIKNIRFSNFLSFGEDNYIDFDKLGGITVVESTPKNFGGKSSATIDLLLFMFFNRTTKTKTNDQIFNRYSSANQLSVKGELNIDGVDYFIERILTRKRTSKGDYKVTNVLNFSKVENGEIIILDGEQRRETEEFIQTAIGSEGDFLSTILTTGYNLEQLIDSKPTERGKILTRFLGLENLEIKGDIAKRKYNDWTRTLTGNRHNVAELEGDIEELKLSMEESTLIIDKLKIENITHETKLKELEGQKEKALSSKNNDVDAELLRTNPERLQLEINKDNEDAVKLQVKADAINVNEPSKFYLKEEHDSIISQVADKTFEGRSLASEIKDKEKSIVSLKEGTICHTCKRPLEGVNHDEQIKSLEDEIKELLTKKVIVGNEYRELHAKDEAFIVIKTEFDEYEKNKLLKAKYTLEIDRKNHEITLKKERLAKYDSNKLKMQENQEIEQKITFLKTEISTTNSIIRQNNDLNLKHSNNIVLVNENVSEKTKLIEEIKKEERIESSFKIYLEIFGKNGIIKEIVRNITPLLNVELHNLLYDSAEFTVELRINEKHQIEFMMIDTETRIEKPLESGSGYEKTIASLALRSVLTKVSSLPKPNIIVMDEVFGKIADENLELVGEFFKKVKQYFDHIVVISHNQLIRNWSDNIVMVQKVENISSIDFINTNVL